MPCASTNYSSIREPNTEFISFTSVYLYHNGTCKRTTLGRSNTLREANEDENEAERFCSVLCFLSLCALCAACACACGCDCAGFWCAPESLDSDARFDRWHEHVHPIDELSAGSVAVAAAGAEKAAESSAWH